MRFLALFIAAFMISVNSWSQDVKLTKKEMKAAKQEREYYNFMEIDTLLKNRSFVLQANWLENEYGVRRPVTSDVNFIMVDSVKAVLQTGFNGRLQGYNGLGGTTAEGTISGLKVDKNMKNHSFFLRFTVMTNIGIYDVAMTVYANTYARATISGMTRGKLIYDGHIANIYGSGVFKGRNAI